MYSQKHVILVLVLYLHITYISGASVDKAELQDPQQEDNADNQDNGQDNLAPDQEILAGTDNLGDTGQGEAVYDETEKVQEVKQENVHIPREVDVEIPQQHIEDIEEQIRSKLAERKLEGNQVVENNRDNMNADHQNIQDTVQQDINASQDNIQQGVNQQQDANQQPDAGEQVDNIQVERVVLDDNININVPDNKENQQGNVVEKPVNLDDKSLKFNSRVKNPETIKIANKPIKINLDRHHNNADKIKNYRVHVRDSGLADFVNENKDDTKNVVKNQQFIRNKEHLKAHVHSGYNIDPEDASEAELDSYFFDLHDTDGNKALDGLEILEAVIHGLEEQFEDIEDDFDLEADEKDEEIDLLYKTAHKTVDKVLEEDDIDNDGYISILEYMNSRRILDEVRDAHEQDDLIDNSN